MLEKDVCLSHKEKEVGKVKQFNVRLDPLEQQMLDSILVYTIEKLGRNWGNKDVFAMALNQFFKGIYQVDPEGLIEILQQKGYEESVRMLKVKQLLDEEAIESMKG